MLQGHEQNAPNLPRQFDLSRGDVAVHFEQALTDPRFEIEDGREGRPIFPFFRDFRVRLWKNA